jgi:hypothetical protein
MDWCGVSSNQCLLLLQFFWCCFCKEMVWYWWSPQFPINRMTSHNETVCFLWKKTIHTFPRFQQATICFWFSVMFTSTLFVVTSRRIPKPITNYRIKSLRTYTNYFIIVRWWTLIIVDMVKLVNMMGRRIDPWTSLNLYKIFVIQPTTLHITQCYINFLSCPNVWMYKNTKLKV